MKHNQPEPGTGGRPTRAVNPPQPAAEAIAELQAQVLALRAVALAAADVESVQRWLTKNSGPTIERIAKAEGWNPTVVKRAKTIAATLRPVPSQKPPGPRENG